MSKPVVAIPADIREIEGNVWQATPNQYVRAAVKGADVTVFLVPALESDNDFDGILDRVDGLLVSGSRTNVHPSLYGKEATDAEGPYDMARDATSLPLISRALERGIPLLAICRGIQELNVVLGGTLANDVPVDGPVLLIYDPTNGAVSFGSIFRIGGIVDPYVPSYAAGEGLRAAIGLNPNGPAEPGDSSGVQGYDQYE